MTDLAPLLFAAVTMNPAEPLCRTKQQKLRADLEERYDGYVVTVPAEDVPLWCEPHENARAAHWERRVRKAGETRLRRSQEALVVRSPLPPVFGVQDLLRTRHIVTLSPIAGNTRPGEWTRWMLAQLGARPGLDAVHDHLSGERIPVFDDQLALYGPERKGA